MNQLQADLRAARRAMGYLSGPMSGETALIRNQHRFRALEVSHQLWELGILHYCPHANSPQVGATDVDYETWMRMDLEVLRRCDWVIMTGEWASSEGCRREFNLANSLKIPIVNTVHEAVALVASLDAGLRAEDLI